jgi:hypothetical protein
MLLNISIYRLSLHYQLVCSNTATFTNKVFSKAHYMKLLILNKFSVGINYLHFEMEIPG